MQEYYTEIIFLNIFAMLITQLCINNSNTLTTSRKRQFYKLFNAIIIASFCEWLGNYLQGSGGTTRILHIVVKAVELSVAPSIGFFVAWIIEKKNRKAIYIYLLSHAVIEVLSGFFGFIYSVDENSVYMHSECYWIYVVAYVMSVAYAIWIVLRNLKRYQYNGGKYFFLVLLFMLTGILIQTFNSSLKVDYVALGMAAIMIYVFTLEMIYQTDELTELVNRRGFENYISHLEDNCILLFIDVDSFKKVNDTYGHAYGDFVLKTIGRTIRNEYAKYGKCFRYGGDEFCIVLTKELDQIDNFNRNVKQQLEQLRKQDNRLPTISIGYAYYDQNCGNVMDSITEADHMMYVHKNKMKKTVRLESI